MTFFPVFLSVICVMRNQSKTQQETISRLTDAVGPLVSDYEIVIVDNASTDQSVAGLKQLTGESGFPNLQVYALTKEVDVDTASWIGLESALGDFLVVIDPLTDDIGFLPQILEPAVTGADVVFADNEQKPRQDIAYQLAFFIYNALYRRVSGLDLAKEAPKYRVLSRRVVNFILQHPQPALTYRHLPATGGFAKANLTYSSKPTASHTKHLNGSIDRGMRLLVSTTRVPMRLVTFLSLFGAFANVLYSIYVVAIGVFKADVAPGWISLSLQQSGMFFLISLVLLVLSEYILNMVTLSNEGPQYHVGQEFTSARMTRREKLNVEVVTQRTLNQSNRSGIGPGD
jgi:hypothetical protein